MAERKIKMKMVNIKVPFVLYEKMVKDRKRKGFASISDYLRHCAMEEIKKEPFKR